MGIFRLALIAGGLFAGLTSAGAMTLPRDTADDTPSLVQKVHSVDEAQDKLDRLGYYNIYIQRASLPYSFIACKRGVRYHIHVDYNGDLEEVDPVGACRENGYGYGNGRRDYDDDDRPRNQYQFRFRPYGYGYGNGCGNGNKRWGY